MEANIQGKDTKFKSICCKAWGQYSIVVIFFGVIILASIFLGDTFLDPQNFLNILRNNSIIGIISLGMAFVIISGNIDLSVGSTLVAVGASTIMVINVMGSIFGPNGGIAAVAIGIVVAVIVGALTGAITGIIITKGRVPSFIVTLGFMSIYRSISMYFMKGGGFFCDVPEFKSIANSDLFGIPLPIIYFSIIAAICYYISKHTKFGRHVYAVGSNEKATRLSGINTDKVKIYTFILMGVMIAIAVVIEASRMNSINATSSGQGYELTAIASVVIGGVAMTGGKGTIVGSIFGILLLGVISNILNIAGVDVFLINAIKGTLIILAVLLQKKEAVR